MIGINRNDRRAFFTAAALVAVAFLCRRVVVWVSFDPLEHFVNNLRSFIYIGLYAAWGVSVSRRVVQSQARKLLTAVAAFMALWFVLREVKYRFIPDENVLRYFWYLYYIPLLMIPLLAFLVSFSLGRSEDYRLPKWTKVLYFVTLALIFLVLTNDFHRLVFSFPEGEVWTEFNRSLGVMYYAVVVWGGLCIIGALVVMVRKCRVPHSRRFLWLPLCPFAAAALYFVLYTLNVPLVRLYLGDFAAFCCVLFLFFFESCIRCGLIQSNSRYSDLFTASVDTAVQITDGEYNVRYCAKNAPVLTKELMKSAETLPVMLDGGKRLQNMPINGGRALWIEDISELTKLRETLADRRDELEERNALLRYEYDREREHRIIEEQNRLYDLIQIKTQAQLDKINALVKEYEDEKSADRRRVILSRLTVLGSYIKRSRDLVLSTDETPEIPENKLSGALAESFRSLGFLGIRGGFFVDAGREYVAGKLLVLAYDFFEAVVEAVFETARYINVRVVKVGDELRINILTDYIPSDSPVFPDFPDARIISEDDGTEFILPLRGGA